MGLLSEGEPLPWNETKKWADHVRQHGVLQFIELYKKLETRKVSNPFNSFPTEDKIVHEIDLLLQLNHPSYALRVMF